jgi:CDGSH-type Zn-finger protein
VSGGSPIPVQPGTYRWCRCGRSRKRPYCDGSHEGTGIEPRERAFSKPTLVILCQCGRSGDLPFCDGSHANRSK